MAMTIFAIGAGGVISMQKTAVQANYDARMLDVATALARTWQERLARDAVSWRTPNDFSGTAYLSAVNAPDWRVPVPTPVLAGGSPAFDLLGRDVAINDPSMIFCTQIRLEWLGGNRSLMRAEVRVIWPRANAAPIATCADESVNPAVQNLNAFPHSLSTATSIRGNF